MNLTPILSLVVGMLVAPAGVKAQDPEATLKLGTASLVLGMSEAEVRSALEPYLVANPGGFIVTKAGPPFTIVGAVVFKNGRLAEIHKHWDEGLNQQESSEAIQRLIDLVGSGECTTTTKTSVEPGARIATLIVRCGRFRVIEASVGVSPGVSKPATNIREIVAR